MATDATVPTRTHATEQARKPGGPAPLRPPAPLKASQLPIIRLAVSLRDSLSSMEALGSRADVRQRAPWRRYYYPPSRHAAHLCPPRRRQPPHRTWIELSATIDFMLATLVGNGAPWSVATLPAIKVNSQPFRRLVKVAVVQILWGERRGDYVHRRECKPRDGGPHATAAQAE